LHKRSNLAVTDKDQEVRYLTDTERLHLKAKEELDIIVNEISKAIIQKR